MGHWTPTGIEPRVYDDDDLQCMIFIAINSITADYHSTYTDGQLTLCNLSTSSKPTLRMNALSDLP